MTAEMTLQAIENDMAIINVQLPAKDAGRAAKAIKYLLTFGGQDVHWLNEEGERLLSIEEVFPDMSPAKVLRGLPPEFRQVLRFQPCPSGHLPLPQGSLRWE